LVSYFKSNGITRLKKHVNANRGLIAKTIEKEMKSIMKTPRKRQPSKKRLIISPIVILNFFVAIYPSKRIMCNKNKYHRIWVFCYEE